MLNPRDEAKYAPALWRTAEARLLVFLPHIGPKKAEPQVSHTRKTMSGGKQVQFEWGDHFAPLSTAIPGMAPASCKWVRKKKHVGKLSLVA